MAQPRAWILGEGFGLVPEDQNQKRERGRESPKLAEKLKNVRIVPNHSIHIHLSPYCCFVILQAYF